MFCHFSSSNSNECNSQMALSPPLSPCQCRRPPFLGILSSLNLLPLSLLLTLSMLLLLSSPSACSPSSHVSMSAKDGNTLPLAQSASSSSSSLEESVRKSPMDGENAEEWEEEKEEEEEAMKMKQNLHQLKKNPHRMIVKRQMKRSAMAEEAMGEDEKPTGEEQEEEQSCTVRVQVVKKVKGKCVRLHGGQSACQSADYLDPVNDDCMFS